MHKQGYREVKLHVILIEVMGTILCSDGILIGLLQRPYRLWQTSIWIAIRLKI
jgi:hypothetical protein